MLIKSIQSKPKPSVPCRLPLDQVAVIILAGGEGRRLNPLTDYRCKPAVSFGGRYSLIDIPISHSLSSGLHQIYVIGQYLSHTLESHVQQSYYPYSHTNIQMISPYMTGHTEGYLGTADAIRKNIGTFRHTSAEYFLILSGDQLYNLNFQELIEFAISTEAGMVIATQPVSEKDARRMGVMRVCPDRGRVTDFYEKPQDIDVLHQFCHPHLLRADDSESRPYLGSMGIYVFRRDVLFALLERDQREDFGKHLIQTQMKHGNVFSYLYDGYWEDIGTIESYYHANLALTQGGPTGLCCYDEQALILTKSCHLPGAKIDGCQVQQALICEGTLLAAEEVTHSIVGVRSVVDQGTIIRDSILMGNEKYGSIDCSPYIGKDCFISHAILDTNVRLGHRVRLTNEAGYQHYTAADGSICVRDGIIIVPKDTVLPDGFIF